MTDDDFYIPPVEEPKKPRGGRGGNTYWHETNTLTHGVIVGVFVLSLLDSPVLAIIGALLAYYVWGPWMVDFAKENNRNINWAYFYGMVGGLIGLVIYSIYVGSTPNPTTPEG